jgi:hypothetical protein
MSHAAAVCQGEHALAGGQHDPPIQLNVKGGFVNEVMLQDVIGDTSDTYGKKKAETFFKLDELMDPEELGDDIAAFSTHKPVDVFSDLVHLQSLNTSHVCDTPLVCQ